MYGSKPLSGALAVDTARVKNMLIHTTTNIADHRRTMVSCESTELAKERSKSCWKLELRRCKKSLCYFLNDEACIKSKTNFISADTSEVGKKKRARESCSMQNIFRIMHKSTQAPTRLQNTCLVLGGPNGKRQRNQKTRHKRD